MFSRKTMTAMAMIVASFGITAMSPADDARKVSSPYWNRSDDGYPNAEETAARMVSETPRAYADATAAKFTYYIAERELNAAISSLRMEIESSEDYQTALNDYRSATLRYEQAKRTALRELRESPEFAARSQLVNQLGEQIKDHHSTSNPNLNHVLTIASMKLDQTRELTEAETIELAGNADVQFAREEMIATYQAMVSQRKQLERTVRNDSALIELRAARNQALIAHAATSSYAYRLTDARDIALRFAAFGKVQDRYTPGDGGYGWNWGQGTYYGSSFRSVYYPIGVPTVSIK